VLIVWKGAASATSTTKSWGAKELVGVIVGTGIGCGLLAAVFLLPYLQRKLIMEDWQLKWYDIFQGPLLLRRGEVPPNTTGQEVVQNYYRGHKTKEELEAEGSAVVSPINDIENQRTESTDGKKADNLTGDRVSADTPSSIGAHDSPLEKASAGRDGPFYTPSNLWYYFNYYFFHGVNKDVVAEQKEKSILTGDLEKMHAEVKHFDNKAEHTYSFLQVLVACTASFAHGANDVSKYVHIIMFPSCN